MEGFEEKRIKLLLRSYGHSYYKTVCYYLKDTVARFKWYESTLKKFDEEYVGLLLKANRLDAIDDCIEEMNEITFFGLQDAARTLIIKKLKEMSMREDVEVTFPMFWFDGNMYFKLIETEGDLEELFKAYEGHMTPDEILDKAKCTVYDPVTQKISYKNFGLRSEHRGDTTLREFLVSKNVKIPRIKEEVKND